MLDSSYNNSLLILSIFMAILAAYTALSMASRIHNAQERTQYKWLAGGACAMGVGIWSMHFVGMLTLNLPVPLSYDLPITLLSLLIAIALSGLALWLVCQATLPRRRLIASSILMGIGISGMHYTGMAATSMATCTQYIPSLVLSSILIAIAMSGAGLWVAFNLLRYPSHTHLLRCVAASMLGLSMAGMHYVGMAAAQFPLDNTCIAENRGVAPEWLALVIIITTLAVLTIALIISAVDQRLASQAALFKSAVHSPSQELSHLSLQDPLTKLPNRILFEDRLERMIKRAQHKQGRFALILMDLDGFQTINDAYGHHIGDQVLIEFARRIDPNMRPQDTFARSGGDEFVLLRKITDPADAANIADRILASIREPFGIAGHSLRISITIGITIYPDNGQDQHKLRTNANASMTYAKSLARGSYSFFEMSMTANVNEQLQLTQDLRRALNHNELTLYYQPKFIAPAGPITGVEALLRWSHPEHGLISPDVFIPLAEKTGLIVPIGEWVLDQACKQLKQWHYAGHSSWSMAVNLSALQFRHVSLTQTVRNALDQHALEACYLTLEVTESTAMRDVDASLRILQQLCNMGVQISIDDFGTGYSSLLYLKRLPANELKIDRGFIRDLANDTEDAAIVSAIVALGKTLKLNIVAEGVETAEQQSFLTDLGCNILQGYLLGRPMSAAQLDQTHPADPVQGHQKGAASPETGSICDNVALDEKAKTCS
ncbi:bifunctional diguanylate cyclase/phosphodiesterase [Alcaligenaceae bacterium]|nr:bifunctional diguanylate cyclase/phosphodiesterase [Alcaligenaceae bacterium]